MTETQGSTLHRYEPDEVLAPGDHLADVLEHLEMTQAELSARTGLSTKHINQIVNGAASITPDTSLLLERATGVPARTWNNFEVLYRTFRSRMIDEEDLAKDVGWLKELPISELAKRGVVQKGATPIVQLRQVCEFFGVANRSAWMTIWQKPTAYRRSRAFTSDPGAVTAWLRLGEIRAADIACAPFDRSGLTDLLGDIRELTRDQDPKSWWPRLRSSCADVGVAIVTEPEIKGARINGAARWLTPTKALLQLSLRHAWSDIFWFTFFHEAGHLLLHSKKEAFLNDTGPHSGVEQEADAFASKWLIPPEHEPQLPLLTTDQDVIDFAKRIRVSPGIVVGRLQHDKHWAYNRGNSLKQRFVFVTSN